jgi:hypothetical protein
VSEPAPLLDREGIEEAFRRLGDRLAKRGVVADIYVFGGAAMALAYDSRRALPGSPLVPPFGRRRLVSGWTGGLGRRGMSDGPAGPGPGGGGAPYHPEGGPRVLERLDEGECLQLIGGGRLGRLAYTGRFGPTVLPVLYKLYEGPVSSTPSGTPSPRGPADRHRAR